MASSPYFGGGAFWGGGIEEVVAVIGLFCVDKIGQPDAQKPERGFAHRAVKQRRCGVVDHVGHLGWLVQGNAAAERFVVGLFEFEGHDDACEILGFGAG